MDDHDHQNLQKQNIWVCLPSRKRDALSVELHQKDGSWIATMTTGQEDYAVCYADDATISYSDEEGKIHIYFVLRHPTWSLPPHLDGIHEKTFSKIP